MTEYHEKWGVLPDETKELHRALKSLQEELEAVDWYNQRLGVAQDDELRAILAHNRNEEIEHAAMLLEWLRRRMEGWDDQLRTYLFAAGSITEAESSSPDDDANTSLGVGDLKGDE